MARLDGTNEKYDINDFDLSLFDLGNEQLDQAHLTTTCLGQTTDTRDFIHNLRELSCNNQCQDKEVSLQQEFGAYIQIAIILHQENSFGIESFQRIGGSTW